MSYVKQTWVDGVSPLNAERMNHIEEGIFALSGGNANGTSIFTGKIASFYGDSLTEVNAHYTKGYHKWIADILGFSSYNNYGHSGDRIQEVINKVDSVTDTADVVFVMCGVNDQNHSTPLGTASDTKRGTIYGGFNELCALMKQKYTTAIIVFITPHYQTKYPHKTGITSYEVSKAMREVCEKYSVPVYDNFVLSGIYNTNLSVFTTDNCHWNDIAHEMVGKNIAKYMENTFRYIYSDNTGEDVHKHSYSETVNTEATCAKAGVKKFACECGDSYTESIPATGHAYVNGVCSVCGAVYSEFNVKTFAVTGTKNSKEFNFTAAVKIDEDFTIGSDVTISLLGRNASNLSNKATWGLSIYGANSAECSNSGFTSAYSATTRSETNVSSDGDVIGSTSYTVNTEPSTEYFKVIQLLGIVDDSLRASFDIEQISVTVNGKEKPILAIGGFFTQETFELT